MQALHWDRGRLARHRVPSGQMNGNALNCDVLLALRARGGRGARGPSEELEWLRLSQLLEDAHYFFPGCILYVSNVLI